MRGLVTVVATLSMLDGISAADAANTQYGASPLMAPANPSLPPALTPSPNVVGSAPAPALRQPRRRDAGSSEKHLQPTSSESALDRRLDICRGC